MPYPCNCVQFRYACVVTCSPLVMSKFMRQHAAQPLPTEWIRQSHPAHTPRNRLQLQSLVVLWKVQKSKEKGREKACGAGLSDRACHVWAQWTWRHTAACKPRVRMRVLHATRLMSACRMPRSL
eukprot:363087-Chlamydomonas_euryale.AAC.6